jgi:hypothetical protein
MRSVSGTLAPHRAMRVSLLALFAMSSGCYSYGPMLTTGAQTGRRETVELLLNERGRADFVGRLGIDALSLEGVLVERRDSTVTVDVQSVTYLNRVTNKWSGERLNIVNGQLRDIRSKRLSMSKTGFAAATVVGGIVAFIVSRGLSGGGNSSPPGSTPPVIQ